MYVSTIIDWYCHDLDFLLMTLKLLQQYSYLREEYLCQVLFKSIHYVPISRHAKWVLRDGCTVNEWTDN